MYWFQNGLCLLPVSLVVLSFTTIILTYVFAVLRKDVDVLLPYISDTATTPPESCFFGFMTFLSACAGILTMFAMYKYMAKLGAETATVSARWNTAALVLGLSSMFGMCIVATFQETSVKVVHFLGALQFFLCGVLYICVQTYLSYSCYPHGPSLALCRVRLILSTISALVFPPRFEWIAALSLVCFFFTYIEDFKKFTLQVRTVCGSEN